MFGVCPGRKLQALEEGAGKRCSECAQDGHLDSHTAPGAGLMNTVISYASGKPSDPLRGYSYVHDSNLRQPRQIAATMYKMLSVTTVLA